MPNRPLPDERPRQSVANLIGRFENQSKRQATNNATPLRSSSVASQITGESANESKEKREWPPKSVSERVASLDNPFPTRSSLPTSQSAPQPIMPQMVPQPIPSETGQKEAIVFENKHEEQNEGSAAPAPKPTAPASPSPGETATKSQTGMAPPIPATPKSAVRTTRKSLAPKQSSSAAPIQPLKPHHTGVSTTSTPSTRKPTSKPSATSTAANSKTLARSASAMPTSTRPKTPSSGLFAPTAASLAKSRNAQVASTSASPVKKPTGSTTASERLSKPTAASLSKARSPVPPTPPLPRATVKSLPGTHSSAKLITKSKAAPQAPSQTLSSPMIATDVVTPAEGNTLQLEPVHPEANNRHEAVNGHSMGEHATILRPYDEGAAPTPESGIGKTSGKRETTEESTDATPEGSHTEQPKPDLLTDAPLKVMDGEFLKGHQLEGHYPSDDGACKHQDHEAKEQVHQGDDIENMVNLLEAVSVPRVRTPSIASMPEEVHEIPDEE